MKFSIITPTYNSEKYLARTMESVLVQEGDFEIEYIIQDGGSTDGTATIVSAYTKKLDDTPGKTISWFTEKDAGMYDAINKGFEHASGDIFAYINSDDIYQPGAFQKIASVFKTFPEIDWISGISSVIDENDRTIRDGKCHLFSREWLRKGIYGRNSYYVPQDAVFWKGSLWKKVRGFDPHYRLAGDYDLWIRLSQESSLWSLNEKVSCFRKREGQLSKNIRAYHNEQQRIFPQTKFTNFFIRAFFSVQSRLDPTFSSIFLWLFSLFFLKKGAEYISIEGEKPIKKIAFSYLAPDPKT